MWHKNYHTGYNDETLEKIVAARSAAFNQPQTMQEVAKAEGELSGALKSLFALSENYPDLKSSENFTQLADELAGTENRIAVARKDYNEAVKAYNIAIRKFPKNLLAGMFGFSAKTLYEASETAQNVPNVEF